MSRLHIQLLGTFQVLQNGHSLTGFRTDKIRALLAYLAVESDRPHRRDSLAALFWPNMDDQKARYNLRLSLHRLRQTLGDDALVLQVERQSVQFAAAQTWVDVYQFRQAMTAVSTHAHVRPETCSTCMNHLATAVAHYHGDFLPGFFLDDDLPFTEWVTIRREQLHQGVLQALNWLTDYYQHNSQVEKAIAHARQQLELEPWRETAHQQLMQALADTGQRIAALDQYETCYRILHDELGVEPSAKTVLAYEKINAVVVIKKTKEDKKVEIHPATSSFFQSNTLSTTPFIGRQEELATLNKLLATKTTRLVTIMGAGGMGKTRLAQACLETQINQFTHGVCFVPLTAVTNPDQLLPAIAQAISFAPDQNDINRSTDQQLFDYLYLRKQLLLLDNFEQLLDIDQGQSSMVVLHNLLESAPQIKLLITSRERLHIHLEHVFLLGGLPWPATHELQIDTYAAVQLFMQSARRLQPSFVLTPSDIPHLVAICRLLDGMPLGLELAAAWIDLLPLAEINIEIQKSLDFLTADMRDWPVRHRSIRAVFDTSWARLSKSEQKFFQQLSLFRGGFTRAAVQSIVGGSMTRAAVLRLLSALVSKSLLQYDRQADRYTLHELLRQYGTEKLADAVVLPRYGRYYCTWLAEQSAALQGGRQKAALIAIEADIDNIQTAWEWAANSQKWTLLFAAAFSLGTYFYRQGRHQEGQSLFSHATALLLTGNDQIIHQQTLAQMLYWQAMFEPAIIARQDLLQLALSTLQIDTDNQTERAKQAAILLELGTVAYGQGQHETAERYFEQSLVSCRLTGDRWGEANVLCELGVSAWSRGAYTEAAHRYGQSLTIRQTLQDHVGTAVALEGLAGTAMFMGEYNQAIAYTQQSLAVYHQLQDPIGIAILQAELGNKNWYRNFTGIELIEDSVRIFADLGTRRHLAHWTVILAMYKADVDIIAAEKLAQEGLRLCQELGYHRGVALAIGVLSRAAWLAEDYSRAQELAQSYLRLTEEMSLLLERSDALTWSAWAYLAVGQWAEAECQVRNILCTPNLWQIAALNVVALLLAHRFPDQYEWAWQLLGYGEDNYGRHRGAVSQQMLARFMPAAMLMMPQSQVRQLKEQGRSFDGKVVTPKLLKALT